MNELEKRIKVLSILIYLSIAGLVLTIFILWDKCC